MGGRYEVEAVGERGRVRGLEIARPTGEVKRGRR